MGNHSRSLPHYMPPRSCAPFGEVEGATRAEFLEPHIWMAPGEFYDRLRWTFIHKFDHSEYERVQLYARDLETDPGPADRRASAKKSGDMAMATQWRKGWSGGAWPSFKGGAAPLTSVQSICSMRRRRKRRGLSASSGRVSSTRSKPASAGCGSSRESKRISQPSASRFSETSTT